MIDRPYEDNEFDGMLMKVHRLSWTTDPFDELLLFHRHKEFGVVETGTAEEDRGKVLRYLVYAYDPKSPFVIYADTVEERRMHAAVKARLYTIGKKMSLFVEDLVKGRCRRFNFAAIRYCILMGDIDFASLVTYESALQKELDNLLDANNDNMGATLKNTEVLRKLVGELREKLLKGDKDVLLTRDLVSFMEAPLLRITPEEHATAFDGKGRVPSIFAGSSEPE